MFRKIALYRLCNFEIRIVKKIFFSVLVQFSNVSKTLARKRDANEFIYN